MISESVSNHRQFRQFVNSMILSASGWRAVFGGSDDSLSTSIAVEARDAAILAASIFANHLRTTGCKTVCVGTDTRPTGPVIAEAVLRSFVASGLSIQYLGRVPSPELMAFVKLSQNLDAFFYVSASHNPPGHNGFKLGDATGAVLPTDIAAKLIDAFVDAARTNHGVEEAVAHALAVAPENIETLFAKQAASKSTSEALYRSFVLSTASGLPVSADPGPFVRDLRARLLSRPIGIVAEMNGSARSVGCDRVLLPEIGARLMVANDRPGQFSHEIVPEGASLRESGVLLQEAAHSDPHFSVAYVPDNDGDRGNLVFLSPSGSPVILEAQAVFALALAIELTWLRVKNPDVQEKIAVAINGPTSIRADRIARCFGAWVFRAEVGEANVVSLARDLRSDGYLVPILGEGSNGGTIVHPATVRDPMNTIFALLKAHAHELYREWCSVSGQIENDAPNAKLLDFVSTLPRFTTTNSNDSRAKMHVKTSDHALLKRRYEHVLPRRIEEALQIVRPVFGPTSWRETNLEGTEERTGTGADFRTGRERGGLRIVFSAGGEDVAAVWMRGSGTEPFFRILADVSGDHSEIENELLSWQRRMVEEADSA